MQSDVFGIVGSVQEGAFRVDAVIAEGGFAVVYRAHHAGFRADVALKCLKLPGTLAPPQEAEFLERFRAEGEVLFRLSAITPAVVRPLHLGTIHSPLARFVPFIALEWLEGVNLGEFVERRRALGKAPLDLRAAVQLLTPAARALEQAHRFPGGEGQVAILHRDLKPENLFVAQVHGRETIKVLDFGISKVKSTATQMVGRASLEESSLNAFTPAYGAPEQWLPRRFGQTGTWTDVWGLGLCLVEVLIGQAPLAGDAHAVMGAAMDPEVRPTPRSFAVATSDTLEAIFRRALAVDPRERYHDVGAFWDDLEGELGLGTTRAAASPGHLDSLLPRAKGERPEPPRLEREYLPEDSTALDLGVPDLEQPEVSKPVLSSRRPAAPLSRAGLDDFDEFASDAGGFAGGTLVPNVGGFRLDAPEALGQPSLDLATSPAPMRERPVYRSVEVMRKQQSSFFASLAGPIKLLVAAALITGLDFAYTLHTGLSFQVGPVRAFWIAGPLAVLAIVKLVFRLADH